MNNPLTQNVSPRFLSLVSVLAMLFFLPILLFATYQTIQLISRAGGTEANIVIDATSFIGPMNTNFYHALAQGGEESTDMIASVLTETRALRPKLIRIDHIFDHYDVVQGRGSNMSFNFSKLDPVVDTIIAAGAKPVISLSYMPASIAQGGSIINPPDVWSDWANAVAGVVKHYSSRSEKNISGVYYECWNEPDLAQFGSWKLSGDKKYLTLYQYCHEGVRQALNSTSLNTHFLGGPSTTGLYENWIKALARSGYRVDFFSWHTYLSDSTRYATDQTNYGKWLADVGITTPKPSLITEFGFTGAKSRLYNGLYAAAHTASVVRQLMDNPPTYAFSFEIKDGPGQEAGDGWGLITHDTNGKRKKSRYFVYSFLDAMAGERLRVTGEGTWITALASKRDGVYRVLLINFDRDGNNTQTVPVTFQNLVPGTYQYTQRSLSSLPTPNTPTTITLTSTTDTKLIYMPSQSVYLLELTRQP